MPPEYRAPRAQPTAAAGLRPVAAPLLLLLALLLAARPAAAQEGAPAPGPDTEATALGFVDAPALAPAFEGPAAAPAPALAPKPGPDADAPSPSPSPSPPPNLKPTLPSPSPSPSPSLKSPPATSPPAESPPAEDSPSPSPDFYTGDPDGLKSGCQQQTHVLVEDASQCEDVCLLQLVGSAPGTTADPITYAGERVGGWRREAARVVMCGWVGSGRGRAQGQHKRCMRCRETCLLRPVRSVPSAAAAMAVAS